MVIEATKARMTVLDPTSAPLPVDAKLADRPDSLNGKVLGLLDNHKNNASKLLDEIHELLAERYDFSQVVRRTKNDVSRPCPKDIVEEMAKTCDVVITAIGD